MVVGCIIYFPRMHPLLVEMEAQNDVRAGLSTEIGDLIGKIFVPAWTLVLAVELRAVLRATPPKPKMA